MVITWAFVIALALFGFVLLMLELFVIPGFGVAGVSAIASILAAVWYANEHLGMWQAVLIFCLTFLASIIVIMRTARTGGMKKLRNSSVSPGKVWDETPKEGLSLSVGAQGVAATMLRPAGTMQVGERRYDVTVVGPIVEKGQAVEVIEVSGNLIKVRAL
jgi:membrane-bound serine protease (ClpP class)